MDFCLERCFGLLVSVAVVESPDVALVLFLKYSGRLMQKDELGLDSRDDWMV